VGLAGHARTDDGDAEAFSHDFSFEISPAPEALYGIL
jgi:hypothetical protein